MREQLVNLPKLGVGQFAALRTIRGLAIYPPTFLTLQFNTIPGCVRNCCIQSFRKFILRFRGLDVAGDQEENRVRAAIALFKWAVLSTRFYWR